jgi:hypothetical protein
LATSTVKVVADETLLDTDGTGDFSGYFNFGGGNDGLKSSSYKLDLYGADGTDSGFTDTATGFSIYLYEVSGTIYGKVGQSDGGGGSMADAGGAVAFTLTVNGSGVVTLDQDSAIVHTNTNSYDEPATLGTGLIKLIGTATDNDNDTKSVDLDLDGKVVMEEQGGHGR